MDDLIKRLLTGQGKLSLFLLEARDFAEKFNDNNLLELIDNETNGYDEKELPDYRKINAEIIGDLQDAFGQVYSNTPLDFSKISDKIGLDLSIAYTRESINYIENILDEIKDNVINRSMVPRQIDLLNKIIVHNYPNYKLIKGSFYFNRAALLNILDKVRHNLILVLKRNKLDISVLESKNSITNSKVVFVTYAWESEYYNDTIISFVNFLRDKGYNATMDKKESQEETSINFNQMMVDGIRNADKVIVVLSPLYKAKVDSLQGGVGFEFGIIMEQLKSTNNKFIFASFGKFEIKDITPIAIGGRDILDLKKDQDENNFNNLFAKLESKNTIVFNEVNKEKVIITQKKIKPFKL